jgi:hypothetical protein
MSVVRPCPHLLLHPSSTFPRPQTLLGTLKQGSRDVTTASSDLRNCTCKAREPRRASLTFSTLQLSRWFLCPCAIRRPITSPIQFVCVSIMLHAGSRLTQEVVRPPELVSSSSSNPVILPEYRSIPSPSALVCYAWYPGATVAAPETYCYVKANRDEPLHLIDGTTGQVCLSLSFPSVTHVVLMGEKYTGARIISDSRSSRAICRTQQPLVLP